MIDYLKGLYVKFFVSEKGQDLTEYALLVALIAVVVMVAVIFFGEEVSNFFQELGTEVSSWFIPS